MYFGGGTPGLWADRKINDFLEFLNLFDYDSSCEVTLEVDPNTWSPKNLFKILSSQVNRLSIGVQSFNDSYLKQLGRKHSTSDVKELLTFLSGNGVNYSIDLMLGLPKVENVERDILKEIQDLLAYNPSHFSVYILKTRSNYSLNNKIPDDDIVAEEYLNVVKYLESYGYKQYEEVSNFAKDNKISKHNIKYWKYESVAAIGPNSTGLIAHKDRALRYRWKSSKAEILTEELNYEETTIEKLYMQLRSPGIFNAKNYRLDIIENIKFWDSLGYLKWFRGDQFELSPKGYLFLDSIAESLIKLL